MSIYKVSLTGRRAFWKPQQCDSVYGTVLSLKNIDLDIPGPVSISVSPPTNHFGNLRKMMRRFKALKRTPIAKSTPSLANLDSENFVRQIATTSVPPSYGFSAQSDQQLDDDSSLLDGVIDLTVVLPDEKQVRMPIDAGTPMMDLLVQVATANGINAGGMMLKVPIDRPPGYLHYKPNMPIGKLGCTTVEVVPKAAVCDRPRKHTPKGVNLPFEPTIRIQVDLPKNQKTVLRVSPQAKLGEILHQICSETNFQPLSDYELRAAKSTGLPLCLDRRLGDVGLVDFAIVCIANNVCKSTNDILGTISKMSQEEKEKRKTRRFFGLFRKKPSAPQPSKLEIQKTTLNGQAAVEVRTPEKSTRSIDRNRPLSMPPSFFECSDGETSIENTEKRDVSSKPKKRQAPLPPAVGQTSSTMHDRSGLNGKSVALSSSNAGRSQHVRRGSDSSSGYHGSSQPSPNPPPVIDASGAIVSSVRTTSGSEKSSYSYKSRTSGVVASGMTEDGVDASAHKKKHKAPLPPPSFARPDAAARNMRPASASPTEPRSSAIREESAIPADSRSSTPATVEDVDKNFQEVIQQIQKQISAEDGATDVPSKTEIAATITQPMIQDSVSKQPLSDGQTRLDSQRSPITASSPVISAIVVETTKPSNGGAVAGVRCTHKPTDLDQPLSVSYAEVQLTINSDKDAKTEELQTMTANSETPDHQTPTSLPLQTDGLLMIKPVEHSPRVTTAEVQRMVVARDNEIPNGTQSGNSEQLNGESEATTIIRTEKDFFIEEIALDFKEQVKKELGDDFNDVAETKTATWKAQPWKPIEDTPPANSKSSSSNILPIATTTFVYKTEVIDASSNRSSSQASPVSTSRWPANLSHEAGCSSQRPSIVYNDPKKNLYPSMKVKSFEDEYYIKGKGAVASDYVKAVKYGMIDEFSSGKEERDKNKEKIEATVAKRFGGGERWQKPTSGSNHPLPTSAAAKPPQAKPLAKRESNVQATQPLMPAPMPTDDINIRLQREYEKLQAMFADWQFRLKQHESIIDAGRKLSPEQILAFQRLQDEMMEQHRYVQGLCADVQQLENESSAAHSTAGPIAVRLEDLKGSARAASMKSGFIQIERRPSEPSAVTKVFMEKMDAGKSMTSKKHATPVESTGTTQPKTDKSSSGAVKSSALWTAKRTSVHELFTSPDTPTATCTKSSNSGQVSTTYSTTTFPKPVEISVQPSKFPVSGYGQGASAFVKRYNSFPVSAAAPEQTQPSIAQHDREQNMGAAISRYVTFHSPASPPPPPPPVMPVSTSGSNGSWSPSRNGTVSSLGPSSKKTPLFVVNQAQKGNSTGTGDWRSDLLASIRSFGGTAGLKKDQMMNFWDMSVDGALSGAPVSIPMAEETLLQYASTDPSDPLPNLVQSGRNSTQEPEEVDATTTEPTSQTANIKRRGPRGQNESKIDSDNGVSLRKACFEVKKFAISGMEGVEKEEAKVRLAVSLGAKRKNKYVNYKELKQERSQAKKAAAEDRASRLRQGGVKKKAKESGKKAKKVTKKNGKRR